MDNIIYYTTAVSAAFAAVISFVFAARQLAYAVTIAHRQKWEYIPFSIPAARMSLTAVLSVLCILTAQHMPSASNLLVLAIYLVCALVITSLSIQDTHLLVSEAYDLHIEYSLNPYTDPYSAEPPLPDHMDLLLFLLEQPYDDYFLTAYPRLSKKWEESL